MAIALMAQVRSLLANFSPLAWRYDQLSPLVFAAIKQHSFPYSSIHASMHYPHLNPYARLLWENLPGWVTLDFTNKRPWR